MPKEIQLAKGGIAIVEDQDYEWLSRWTWRRDNEGYVVSKDGKVPTRKTIYMHRVILGLKQGEVCDHINRVRHDNRRENLRKCTQADNNHNAGLKSTNTSGYKGVSWSKASHKWRASIRTNNKPIELGLFYDVKEAAAAYDAAARRYFGEFAKTNFL